MFNLTTAMKRHIPHLLSLFVLMNSIHLFADDLDTTSFSIFDRSIEELIEQEVSIATKSSQKISQTPSVVSVITAEEIKAMGYRDLEEVLQTIPGFETTQSRPGIAHAGIRGVTDIRQGGRLLVLLDGSPYNDEMYGSAIFFGYTFNLDAVERIEVIRGPGSALYGRNAFSGVVNIITKKADSDNNMEVSASYGSYNTLDASASYGIKKKSFNANITTKYYKTDGTNSTYNNGEGGESIWNLSHDNLYLNTNAEYKKFKFFGSYSQRIDGNAAAAGDFLTNGSSTFKIGTYNLMYNTDISSNIQLNFKLYGRNENRVQDIELTTPSTIGYNAIYPEGAYARPVFDAYTYGTELELKLRLLKNNQLLVGLQGDLHGIKNATVKSNYDLATGAPLTYIDGNDTLYYHQGNMPIYEPGWIKDNGHAYQNAAFYFQDVHYFLDNLSLTVGGRLDYDSEVGIIFNPRLGMVFEPSSSTSLKLLYGKAYRAPTANEQYKLIGLDKGNENLKPEDINTIELVFAQSIKKLFYQVSFYYNYLDNLILQLNINDSSNFISYFNKGKNTSYGFEFETKYILTKHIYSFANYSYNLSEDIQDRNGVEVKTSHANISKHKFNIGLNTRILRKLNWSILLRYKGEIQKYINEIEGAPDPYISQDKVGDFFLLNSTIFFPELFKGFNFSIQGYNLLNTKYYYQDDKFPHQPAQQGTHFLLRASYNFNL